MKKFPEYWYIKADKDNPLWSEFLEWINKAKDSSYKWEGLNPFY
jgi:hypothetical protein